MGLFVGLLAMNLGLEKLQAQLVNAPAEIRHEQGESLSYR